MLFPSKFYLFFIEAHFLPFLIISSFLSISCSFFFSIYLFLALISSISIAPFMLRVLLKDAWSAGRFRLILLDPKSSLLLLLSLKLIVYRFFFPCRELITIGVWNNSVLSDCSVTVFGCVGIEYLNLLRTIDSLTLILSSFLNDSIFNRTSSSVCSFVDFIDFLRILPKIFPKYTSIF